MTKFHYVYRITNIVSKRHYYGVKSSSCHTSLDIGIKYFSSSKDKEFMIDQKENPQNYRYKVVKIFNSRKEALQLEIKLHHKFDVGINKNFYNLVKQTSIKFDSAGCVIGKNKIGEIKLVRKDSEEYISGEYKSINVGYCVVKDKHGKLYKVSIEDEKYKNGEYIGINSGMMPVKDKHGNIMQISVDDPRFLTGELVHITKGKTVVKDKDGNTSLVSKDDERYKSGELEGVAKGLIPVKDKYGNKYDVSKDDERYKSGELVHVTKGLLVMKDKDGNIFSVTRDDPRILSGELIGKTKGCKWVHNDINKKSFLVDLNKYELKEGDCIGFKKY